MCFPEAEQWYNGIRQRIRELSFPRQHHFSGSRALRALAGRLHFTGRGLKKMSTRCRDDCILIVDVAKCVDDQPGKTNGKAIGPGIHMSIGPGIHMSIGPGIHMWIPGPIALPLVLLSAVSGETHLSTHNQVIISTTATRASNEAARAKSPAVWLRSHS